MSTALLLPFRPGAGDISGMPAIDSSAPDATGAPLSSTETLLRNIQSLLKVAADNARQQERQISYEKGESNSLTEWGIRWCCFTDTQSKSVGR